jgi:hypothetical protein
LLSFQALNSCLFLECLVRVPLALSTHKPRDLGKGASTRLKLHNTTPLRPFVLLSLSSSLSSLSTYFLTLPFTFDALIVAEIGVHAKLHPPSDGSIILTGRFALRGGSGVCSGQERTK